MFPSSESNNSGVVYGGNDTITVGNGNNVIVGGLGADTITTGTGSNVVLGDSGFAVFNPSTGTTTSFGNLIEVASDPVTFASGAPQLDLTTRQYRISECRAHDTITLGNGNNVVIGGADADTIVVGATGQNVIIGDDGEADYTNGILTDIFSTDGTLGIGGNDTISGPERHARRLRQQRRHRRHRSRHHHARRRQQHGHRRRRQSDIRHVRPVADDHHAGSDVRR